MLRRLVARYLGRIRTDEAFEALAAVVADPAVAPMIRTEAAAGLGEMRDPRAFEPLTAVLRQEDIRFVTPEMERELQRLREMRTSAPSPMAEQLTDMINRSESGRSLHDYMLEALRELHDPRTVDLLFAELGTEDEEHQGAIAAAIGDAGDMAIAPLLAALGSKDGRVRTGAALALGYAKEPRAIDPLTAMLLHDPDVGARRAAASSLGFIEDERVAGPLIEGLRDEDLRVRQSSAFGLYSRALVGHADSQALPPLEWVAEHDAGTIYGHHAVRDVAARAIKEIRRAR